MSGRGAPRIRFADPDKLVGALIGRYRVIAPLGVGGMGSVLAARSVDTGEEVAIKILRPQAVTEANLKRFQREVKVLTSLRHPHVCQTFGHGMFDTGAPYMVMELLRGETLHRRLAASGALKLGDAIGIALQVLDALAAAHAIGVVHRDLKPANIFLTSAPNRAPHAKLIDFGLARLLPRATARAPARSTGSIATITKTDEIAGTPSYLCPEQISGARDLDERVDVWGVGVVLYEMIAGHRAFAAESLVATHARIAYEDPIPLRAYRADVPFELEAVLAQALAKPRIARFRSAAVFRQALLACWVSHRGAAISTGQALAAGVRVPRAEAPTVIDPDDADTEVGPISQRTAARARTKTVRMRDD